jgi:hypothetical protein
MIRVAMTLLMIRRQWKIIAHEYEFQSFQQYFLSISFIDRKSMYCNGSQRPFCKDTWR